MHLPGYGKDPVRNEDSLLLCSSGQATANGPLMKKFGDDDNSELTNSFTKKQQQDDSCVLQQNSGLPFENMESATAEQHDGGRLEAVGCDGGVEETDTR